MKWMNLVNVEGIFSKESEKAGLPPGTLLYSGDESEEKTDAPIRIIEYNETENFEKYIQTIEEIDEIVVTDKILWIHTTGLWNVEKVRRLGEKFNIMPLSLEDVVSRFQRPKIEDFENYIYVILKHVCFDAEQKKIMNNQISIITLDNVVLTFSEKPTFVFDQVIRRIQKDGRIRKYGADYLTYALIDVIVDHYFFVLEAFEEWSAEIEKKISGSFEKEAAAEINNMRNELSQFNKSVWPLVGVIEKIEKIDSKLIKKGTRVYFRDVSDHVLRITEAVDSDREVLSGIFDLYNSNVSNRLNETIRLLTVISTVFIPLTFIAGVYGMNFRNIPELYWEYGYFACLAAMAVVTLLMLVYFRKKEWI